jgi:hypothetical protein
MRQNNFDTGRFDRFTAPRPHGNATKTMAPPANSTETKLRPSTSTPAAPSKAALEAERRASQRFVLVASADVLDLNSGMRISARVADLSLSGCYMDCLSPLPVGSNLHLRISCNSQSVELKGAVRFSHSGLGMGVGFATLTPNELETIGRWMGAMEASKTLPTALAPEEEHSVVMFATPAAAAGLAASKPRKCFEELFTLLVRKGILSETEMQNLLAKL